MKKLVPSLFLIILFGCGGVSEFSRVCPGIYTGRIVYPDATCNGFVVQITSEYFPESMLVKNWPLPNNGLDEEPTYINNVFGVFDVCHFSEKDRILLQGYIDRNEEFTFAVWGFNTGENTITTCERCDLLVSLPEKIHTIALSSEECVDHFVYVD